jgi:hypothetical protein
MNMKTKDLGETLITLTIFFSQLLESCRLDFCLVQLESNSLHTYGCKQCKAHNLITLVALPPQMNIHFQIRTNPIIKLL